MRRRTLWTALIALLVPLTAGFTTGETETSPTSPTASDLVDGAVVAGPGGFVFPGTYATPASVVTQGGSLTLYHADIALHDVVATDLDQHGDPLFRSPLIGLGATADVVGVPQLASGVYGFYCSLHPWMTGQLVVAPGTGGGGGGGGGGDGDGDDDGSDGGDPGGSAGAPVPTPGGELDTTEAWPVYGGDLANSRHRADEGPSVDEVLNLSAAWTFETEDEGDFSGTPVVADGRVFVGSSLGRVFALDAENGEVLWKVDLNGENRTAIITATAAVYGGVVYLPVSARTGPDYTPYVLALDAATGAEQWRTYTDPDQPLGDLYGSPTIWAGARELPNGAVEPFAYLYIGTSSWDSGGSGGEELHLGNVQAMDLRNHGKVVWRTFMFEGGPSDKNEVPTDPETGQQYNGAAVWSTPTVDTETATVYVGTGNGYTTSHSYMDSIVALDAFTGDIRGAYHTTGTDAWQLTAPYNGVDADFGSSPQLIDGPNGERWVGAGQKNNHVVEDTTGSNAVNTMVGTARYHMLDRDTLEPVWVATVGPGYWLGGFLGSTAYDGERIYGGTVWGQQVALDKADGSIAWMAPTADPPGLHHAPTTVANGVVYSADAKGVVHAWDAATGIERWAGHLGVGPSAGGVAVVGDTVFVTRGLTTASGSVTAFRLP